MTSTFLVCFEEANPYSDLTPIRSNYLEIVANTILDALNIWLQDNAPYCDGFICVHIRDSGVTVQFPTKLEAL